MIIMGIIINTLADWNGNLIMALIHTCFLLQNLVYANETTTHDYRLGVTMNNDSNQTL